mgnify:CR=1 FL=1
MRFIFKTDYRQDIRLAKHPGHVFWYSLLALLLLAAPWLFAEYWLAQLTFVLIYAIAGLGLMLLAGFTGLFGYLGGAVAANAMLGYTVDHFGWDGGFVLLVGACLLAMAFLAPTLWHKQVASQSREAVA